MSLETHGLCACGCGEPVSLAKKTDWRRGVVKGQPLRFAGPGHWLRTADGKKQLLPYRWKGAEVGFSPLHKWLRNHFPKTGRCERCQEEKKTDWAFIHHPLPYTRKREDYRELCRSCHMQYDYQIGYRTKRGRTRA